MHISICQSIYKIPFNMRYPVIEFYCTNSQIFCCFFFCSSALSSSIFSRNISNFFFLTFTLSLLQIFRRRWDTLDVDQGNNVITIIALFTLNVAFQIVQFQCKWNIALKLINLYQLNKLKIQRQVFLICSRDQSGILYFTCASLLLLFVLKTLH